MARSDGRIEPGQSLRGAISARAWNRAQDAADIVFGSANAMVSGKQQYLSAPYSWVYMKRNAGQDDYFPGRGVWLGDVTTPSITSEEELGWACSQPPVFQEASAQAPSPSDLPKTLGVTVEPIAAGGVGRVAVSGIVPCSLAVTDEADRFCSLVLSNPYGGILSSRPTGPVAILYKSPPLDGESTKTQSQSASYETRLAYAVVEIGRAAPPLRIATISQTGGLLNGARAKIVMDDDQSEAWCVAGAYKTSTFNNDMVVPSGTRVIVARSWDWRGQSVPGEYFVVACVGTPFVQSFGSGLTRSSAGVVSVD